MIHPAVTLAQWLAAHPQPPHESRAVLSLAPGSSRLAASGASGSGAGGAALWPRRRFKPKKKPLPSAAGFAPITLGPPRAAGRNRALGGAGLARSGISAAPDWRGSASGPPVTSVLLTGAADWLPTGRAKTAKKIARRQALAPARCNCVRHKTPLPQATTTPCASAASTWPGGALCACAWACACQIF